MSELYAVTSGDPAGIGPDISLKIALREDSHQFVVFGNMDLLRERSEIIFLEILQNSNFVLILFGDSRFRKF